MVRGRWQCEMGVLLGIGRVACGPAGIRLHDLSVFEYKETNVLLV